MRLYLLKLILYLFIGMVILKLPILQPWVDEFCLLLAKSVSGILGLFDAGIERHGIIVLRDTYGYAVAIGKECSALEFVIAISAATLACPAPILKRIKVLVIFIIVFQLLNVFRLMTLIYAKVLLNAHFFDIFHEQFWIFLLSILATGLFLFLASQTKLNFVQANERVNA